MQDFAQAAYRRPLTAEETKHLLAFYESVARKEEYGIEEAVRASIIRILVSPHFCYRLELPPAGKTIQPVSDLTLASRLSYFLWASMPDKELLDLAARGELKNDKTLRTQMQRMLNDPRVSGFAREFFGQWLQYGDFLSSESVNRQVFPEFDDALKQAMFEEPTRFATGLIQNDRSVLDLLNSDTSYVNKRLARHYGIPFRGDDASWEKTTGLLQQGRGGFLGMAVFLTKNSQPARTSPVKRGFWVVHKLLGEHIPAPPANVPVLPAKETDTKGKSIRDLLALHTADATCARCHQRFDPVGLSMEGFDAIGKSRTKDLAGRPVDNLVRLPSGKAAHGIPEFSNYLATERKDDFTRTLCRKFLGFALGRSLELSDRVLLDKMQAELEKNDYRLRILFETLVMSPQFRMQRGKSDAPAVLKNTITSRRHTVNFSKPISRRLLLQGLGCTIALPWLESAGLFGAEPAAVVQAKVPHAAFACLFIGDGISPNHWWSKGDGAAMELGSSLTSLGLFASEKLNVLNGLHNKYGDGGHAKCTGNILSGANLQRGRVILGGVSMDQKLSQHFEEATPVPSMVLGCEHPVSGFHESQYSMVYASHISWRTPNSPIPIELYPALAFDSLFGGQTSKLQGSITRRRTRPGE